MTTTTTTPVVRSGALAAQPRLGRLGTGDGEPSIPNVHAVPPAHRAQPLGGRGVRRAGRAGPWQPLPQGLGAVVRTLTRASSARARPAVRSGCAMSRGELGAVQEARIRMLTCALARHARAASAARVEAAASQRGAERKWRRQERWRWRRRRSPRENWEWPPNRCLPMDCLGLRCCAAFRRGKESRKARPCKSSSVLQRRFAVGSAAHMR